MQCCTMMPISCSKVIEVFGLLVVLLGESQGVETYCDGRQDGARCDGVLGGSLSIQLMSNSSDIPIYNWKKGLEQIYNSRQNKIVSKTMESRTVLTLSNGTIRINNLSWTDGGNYTLEIFNSAGVNSGQRTLQLSVRVSLEEQFKDSSVEPEETSSQAKLLIVLIAGLAGLLLVLAIAISVICALGKIHNKVEVADQEVNYADVKVVQLIEQMERYTEAEGHHCRVEILELSDQARDNCEYAQVCKEK
ncbi:uncharacterized protein LOC119777891 isoform X2 [Cyprinodon tularosa]|uniref:uncharacterized protein LOC119777891 isoform X2 n=1 Tax=Cyprinodon tularosa TaxID=77115 RepID=UPI0018E23EB7|nr:uncharacterized protein LOC119777891 isoform X2 [Cyprinodon tularosa]